MTPEQRQIQELQRQVNELTRFMMSFENSQSVNPNHALTIKKIVGAVRLADLEDVSNATPSSGQVLKFNGTLWAPGTDIDT